MADKDFKTLEQDSLFREIEEDLRQENLAKLWKKYGGVVIAAALGLVVAVAGFKAWQAYDINQREKAATIFLTASADARAGKTDEAQRAFQALAADAPGGYALLARFRSAAETAQKGDKAAAAQAYRALAADTSVTPLYRDMAEVLAALALVDSADPADLRARMARISDDANPWRFSAREITALAALRAGDTAQAHKLFAALAADPATPGAMRQRAQALQSQLK